MSNVEKKENIGGLIISEDVIADIAKNASRDIEGVSGFASRPVIEGILKKSTLSKSIRVISKDNELVIEMNVILKEGYKIPVVCEKIQKNVKEAVQNMTGKVINKVNVKVYGINFAKVESEQN